MDNWIIATAPMVLLRQKPMATAYTTTKWNPPSGAIGLGRDEVHVWLAHLDQPDHSVADCRAILSDGERARADRFRFERDRTAYTVARAALKMLLSSYLGIPSAGIEFEYSAHGKPYLSLPANSAEICFNISHSHGLALLAFSIGRLVGVDVEQVRPDFGTLEIARRFFSPTE